MSKPKYNAYAEGHRSGLEDAFRDLCDKEGLLVTYETDSIPFIAPSQKRRYTPDWKIADKCYIETKGRFTAADRKKAILIKEQHPGISILYVLYRDQRLSKKSNTTYLMWAKERGLEACVFKDKDVWVEFIKKHLMEVSP